MKIKKNVLNEDHTKNKVIKIEENIKYVQKWELLWGLKKNALHEDQCWLLLWRLEKNVLHEGQTEIKSKSKDWRKY